MCQLEISTLDATTAANVQSQAVSPTAQFLVRIILAVKSSKPPLRVCQPLPAKADAGLERLLLQPRHLLLLLQLCELRLQL